MDSEVLVFSTVDRLYKYINIYIFWMCTEAFSYIGDLGSRIAIYPFIFCRQIYCMCSKTIKSPNNLHRREKLKSNL